VYVRSANYQHAVWFNLRLFGPTVITKEYIFPYSVYAGKITTRDVWRMLVTTGISLIRTTRGFLCMSNATGHWYSAGVTRIRKIECAALK
jgi:hypothetical protein